jgi:hypothetical protein
MHKGWIYEVLVSTYANDAPHAAPIGISTDDSATLRVETYESQTRRNMLATGHLVANFPSSADMLFRALYAPHLLSYEAAEQVRAPTVVGSSAVVELIVEHAMVHGVQVRAVTRPILVRIIEPPTLLNRAEGLLLESLILATRIEHLDHEVVEASLRENLRVVSKVAPGSRYEGEMAEILRALDLVE